MIKNKVAGIGIVILLVIISFNTHILDAKTRTLNDFIARTYVHAYKSKGTGPQGLTPAQIRTAYNLPTTGGSGTIAIISAYAYQNAEYDLGKFDQAFFLRSCTIANGCLEIHPMTTTLTQNDGWNLETALDIQWAHAIAPTAKILVVEAKSSKGSDLVDAITFATKQPNVVAVSMSWGGPEFSDETSLDSHFNDASTITFFAASGDEGSGTSWPAASAHVVAVGGSSLTFTPKNDVSEKAWSGSGGGISLYEQEPVWQKDYAISKAKNMRAIPDVSYNADPNVGFSVFKSPLHSVGSNSSWYVIGGTSAGTPQWAAIKALGLSVSLQRLYSDKSSTTASLYFRDIVSGSNGTCTYYCDARKRYDYITGLGSPLTIHF